MKRKFFIGTTAIVLAGCLVGSMAAVMADRTKTPVTSDSVTVETTRYQSAVGGNILQESDKDYVSISGDSIISKNATVAADGVGRTLSTTGSGDNGRQVAVFYTLGADGTTVPQIFEDVLNAGDSLTYGLHYWWAKPMFGYYHTSDDYILRKHIEMLTYADVDYLVFDTTNGMAFTTEALKVMKLLHEYRAAGWDAPQVAFYTNTDSVATILTIYSDIYEQNKYPDTWYMVDGKPLIIGTALPTSCKNFFTFRASQWPGIADVDGAYPWIDFNDVARVRYDFNGEHGVIPVSVAQNSSSYMSDNVLYGLTAKTGGSRGRSYHDGDDNITDDSVLYGYNFQEEWDTAINSDAETALILQWNEWRAGVYRDKGKLIVFDLMTPEYSRDIEPMEGGFGDNYYMQMVENIRKFKNTGSKVTQTEKKTIDISGDFSQWSAIPATYADMPEGGIRRDALGYGDQRYVNTTGRNEMIYAKITQDSDNVYFYVQTAKDITDDYSTGSWMNLFLDTDGVLDNSWNGYEYIVNYSASSDGTSTVARYNGSSFETAGEAKFRVYGNQMMVSVPKSVLGLSGTGISLNFKWADSRTAYSVVTDYYTLGDTMPYGRFNYAYHAE